MSNTVLQKSRFIHIPKCAGTFLQAVLYALQIGVRKTYNHPHNGHLCLHMMPEEDYYNFTFVRHPYTWWPSYYYYMQRGQKAQGKEALPFDEWLQLEGPFWLGHYTSLVKRFIGVDELYPTKNKMHFVGKSEALKEDLFKALTEAGEEFKINWYHKLFEDKSTNPHNWTNTQEYNREISDESKDLIYRGERWVFDTFEYLK